jgi:thymidylate synthase
MHFGDAHLYENHYNQAEKQIARGLFIRKAPTIRISNRAIGKSLKNVSVSDINIEDYEHLGKIKAEMAV